MECFEFRETEKERKFYEDKKRKALQVIDDFIRNMEHMDFDRGMVVGGLNRVRRLVNDI
tara:strand:- start:2612 stop:2788 length:177 start_codon:yes stop_codon:yes gene_type:complete